jgi:hypothetical protein
MTAVSLQLSTYHKSVLKTICDVAVYPSTHASPVGIMLGGIPPVQSPHYK